MVFRSDLPHSPVIKAFHHTFRFVRHRDAAAYLKLSWVPTDDLVDTYYEQFSVLFEWQCECDAPEPKGERE